jgi:hypothetical protein
MIYYYYIKMKLIFTILFITFVNSTEFLIDKLIKCASFNGKTCLKWNTTGYISRAASSCFPSHTLVLTN